MSGFSFQDVPATIPSSSQDAWEYYLQCMDEARALALNSTWCKYPVDRAQALYNIQMLSAFGFNIYTAPRQQFPNFYTHTIFLPFEYGFGAPSPDFFYRWAFLDGTKTYRIWGNRGNTAWAEFQAQGGFWGDEDQFRVGNWDFDDFKLDADGSFEIIASPEPHDGNWMKLDPKARNIVLMLRDAHYDWLNDQALELRIETLDRTEDAIAHSEAEMDRRLRAIGRMAKFAVQFFLKMNDDLLAKAGFNTFRPDELNQHNNVGGNPRAAYVKMLYDIQPDDALIIETEIPNARYWSVQLNDVWWQTTDYAYHQSCINAGQAAIDSDGKVRMVLSLRDPGVMNWLDPVDFPWGVAQWRWYLTDRIVTPTVKKVPVTEVRTHLPAETALVTRDERQSLLAIRRKGIFNRYGF
jgi:hypothetical protein